MSDTGCDDGCDELYISMDRVMIWYLAATISFALAGMLIYLYFLRNGQFEDIEDAKYQMFRDEE